MPSKKKKYNARFPAGRIKKIMQTDEEVGKVAQAVPVIISRTLELFVESLLTKTLKITNARNAKTLSPSHMKQCIISESRFDFLRDLVKNIPDMGLNEDHLSGSEAGYGNEGTSPASTSTSSSSYSNGGTGSAAAAAAAGHLPYEVHSKPLLRSESYSPATTASISVLSQHHTHHHPLGKRGLSHQGASLNFYKEIPLDGTDSPPPPPPPPPKLTRLNSAPAASSVAAPLPFKIDILPTLPPSASAYATTGTGRRGSAATAAAAAASQPPPSASAITPQISYKVERGCSEVLSLEPVIKLDYSNLRLPATSTSPHGTTTGGAAGPAAAASRAASLMQPTIKIDLSSIATAGGGGSGGVITSTAEYGTTTRKHNTAALEAPGTAGGVIKQTASSSTTTTTVLPPAQSPVVPTAPPLFSALSSSIPGMDEDYDDI